VSTPQNNKILILERILEKSSKIGLFNMAQQSHLSTGVDTYTRTG
jgi:hypothetical protein